MCIINNIKLILKNNINKYFFNKTKSKIKKIKKSENIKLLKIIEDPNNINIQKNKTFKLKYLKTPPKIYKFDWFNLNYYYPEIKKIKI